jgi:hypothetical protein
MLHRYHLWSSPKTGRSVFQWRCTNALFERKPNGQRGLRENDLRVWNYPPQPANIYNQRPANANAFFARPFCLWMPFKMSKVPFNCHLCNKLLTGGGLYRTVRAVIDESGFSYLATEVLECKNCKKKFSGWHPAILKQLDPATRARFPCALSYK